MQSYEGKNVRYPGNFRRLSVWRWTVLRDGAERFICDSTGARGSLYTRRHFYMRRVRYLVDQLGGCRPGQARFRIENAAGRHRLGRCRLSSLVWRKDTGAAINNTSMPTGEKGPQVSLRNLTITALTLSLVNPYALIDTVLVIGSISGSKPTDVRWAFAGGAMAASLFWFSILAAGTSFFRSLFEHATM